MLLKYMFHPPLSSNTNNMLFYRATLKNQFYVNLRKEKNAKSVFFPLIPGYQAIFLTLSTKWEGIFLCRLGSKVLVMLI